MPTREPHLVPMSTVRWAKPAAHLGSISLLGLSLSAPLTFLTRAEPGSLPVAISASQFITPFSISGPLEAS